MGIKFVSLTSAGGPESAASSDTGTQSGRPAERTAAR